MCAKCILISVLDLPGGPAALATAVVVVGDLERKLEEPFPNDEVRAFFLAFTAQGVLAGAQLVKFDDELREGAEKLLAKASARVAAMAHPPPGMEWPIGLSSGKLPASTARVQELIADHALLLARCLPGLANEAAREVGAKEVVKQALEHARSGAPRDLARGGRKPRRG